MKTRRLSEIDLARLASIPPGPQLETALRAYNAGGGSWSYDPVRASTPDILGTSVPLYGALAETSWEKIARQISVACRRGDKQVQANLQVGKVLFDFSRTKRWLSANHIMGRLPIGIGETVRYWSDVVLADEEGPFIPFFDHRREHGVAERGVRQIVFSMQNLWVRERNPDLARARLAVVRFPSSGDSRMVSTEFHSEDDLISYEDLNQRVCAVYETWARISRETNREHRGTGTDGQGSLDF